MASDAGGDGGVKGNGDGGGDGGTRRTRGGGEGSGGSHGSGGEGGDGSVTITVIWSTVGISVTCSPRTREAVVEFAIRLVRDATKTSASSRHWYLAPCWGSA